jgi:leucyl-tRNA synthetase
VARDASQDQIVAAALASPNVAQYLAGMEIVKTVVPNGRLVSVVVRPGKV